MPGNRHRPLVIAFDLEMNQPSNRIIQIGAVAGDLDSGRVLDTFSQLVDPGEPLSARIEALTGIAAAALPQAPPLAEAFARFVGWAEPMRGRRVPHLLTWGVWDFPMLREQVGGHPAGWPFGQRWIDVKAVYQAWRQAHGHTGLGELQGAVANLGLAFAGRAHDAAADALNTFGVYVALLRRFNPERSDGAVRALAP